MTDFAPDPLPEPQAPALAEAAAVPGLPPAELTMAADPSNRLLEYIRSGKFSPEIANQLQQALNEPGAAGVLAAAGNPADSDVLATAANMATVCVLAILLVAFVNIGLALSGVVDPFMLWVIVALFIVVLLAVVSVSGLKVQPIKVEAGRASSLSQPAAPAAGNSLAPAPVPPAR